MNTDLTLHLAVFLFAAISAGVATGEPPVSGSLGPMLVVAEPQCATHMLQLRWKTQHIISPEVSGPKEELFWFTDGNLPRQERTPLDENEAANSNNSLGTGSFRGKFTGIRIETGVEEISRDYVGIKVSIAKIDRPDENPVMLVEELLKIPRTSVGSTTQGKLVYTARWWCLAQPIRAPEPRSGRSKMEASSGAAR